MLNGLCTVYIFRFFVVSSLLSPIRNQFAKCVLHNDDLGACNRPVPTCSVYREKVRRSPSIFCMVFVRAACLDSLFLFASTQSDAIMMQEHSVADSAENKCRIMVNENSVAAHLATIEWHAPSAWKTRGVVIV